MVRNCAPENLEIPGSVLSDRPGMTVQKLKETRSRVFAGTTPGYDSR
jgi:hypothetical protein